MERHLAAVLTGASLSACLVASAALPNVAAAQPGAPLPAPRFGVMAGVNSSTVAGDDVADEDNDRRTGLVAGVYLSFPLGTVLAVQPELLYSMKGASAGAGSDAADVNLDYVEVPVLLRANFGTGTGVRPYVFAGPTFSFRVRCEITAENVNVGCDELDGAQPGEDTPEFKRFDLGAALGAGVAIGVGTASALNLGVRYTHGTSSVIEPGDVMNRVFSVTAGLEFPFGGR